MQTLFTLVLKIISIFIITVIVSIIVAQYVSKTRKFKNKNRKDLTKVGIVVGSILICIIGIIGYCKWYFGPLPGYSEEFIKKGNPMTRFEMDGYHQDMGTGGGFGIDRSVDYCMSQQDFDVDAKYAKEAGIFSYNYILSDKQINKCKMIKMDAIGETSLMIGFTNEYKMSSIGKRKENVDIYLPKKGKVNIDFKNEKLKNITIYAGQNSNFNLEGIEYTAHLQLQYKGKFYNYNLHNKGELNKFLSEWGWKDKGGYYGKKYKKISEENLIKLGLDNIYDLSDND